MPIKKQIIRQSIWEFSSYTVTSKRFSNTSRHENCRATTQISIYNHN